MRFFRRSQISSWGERCDTNSERKGRGSEETILLFAFTQDSTEWRRRFFFRSRQAREGKLYWRSSNRWVMAGINRLSLARLFYCRMNDVRCVLTSVVRFSAAMKSFGCVMTNNDNPANSYWHENSVRCPRSMVWYGWGKRGWVWISPYGVEGRRSEAKNIIAL
eukprot:scaffold2914_cov178-Amphora_coffeaeformis.AAC.17